MAARMPAVENHLMAFFDLVITTSASLHPDGEPSDFVSEYTGTIRCTDDSTGRVRRVGRVRAYRIHAALAREAGESVFDACDSHSQEMHEVYAAVFDTAEDDIREDLRQQFDGFDSDVLVVDYVLLSPRWRGLRVGLLAARKLVDLLGGGCGLVVSFVHPLNAEADQFLRVPAGWIPRHTGRDEEREARRKLRRYFRRMGFRRIEGTRFDGLSTAQPVPSLSDLLRGSGQG
jgi:hypothetical protein